MESRRRTSKARGVSQRDCLRNTPADASEPDHRRAKPACLKVIDMLQTMNTGHDGSMTTIHANSARDGVSSGKHDRRWPALKPLKATRSQDFIDCEPNH
jgi:pilus assembly protein CpaF